MLRKWILLSGLSLVAACTAPTSDSVATSTSALHGNGQGTSGHGHSRGQAEHVMLISVDGFHEFDLDAYVALKPASALAGIVQRGVKYAHATATRPSDSFPATMAMVTGGSPRTTGVFYDVMWSDRLSPPKSACATRGTLVSYNQAASFDASKLDTTINPLNLPLDPDNGCVPYYPHSFLKVNTVYEVIKAAGMRTAACEKHASYDILNGPSGAGVDDLYTPEAEANGAKKSITLTEANDEFKVKAVINQIRGYDHTGTTQVGVPAIFGMNFQSINIGQKIAGYTNAAGTPAAGLAQAFDYVDGALGRIVAELQAQGLLDSTRIIFTSKSGNAPVDPAARIAIDPLKYDTVINGVQAGLRAQVTADTVALIWLKDHSRAADVAAAIQANAALLGAETIYSGDALMTAFGGTFASTAEVRPDVIVQPVHGVVYTTATKLADHGGFGDEELHIPLVVSQPGLEAGTNNEPVDLRQVAPTILKSLGLQSHLLEAVRAENVKRLPGLHVNESCDHDDDDHDHGHGNDGSHGHGGH
jgi:hypothetical protein